MLLMLALSLLFSQTEHFIVFLNCQILMVITWVVKARIMITCHQATKPTEII